MSPIDFINKIYEEKGGEGYGEHVTQLQHALQGATIAVERGYDTEIVVAVLLHDIGHLMDCEEQMGKLGTVNHEDVGADYLLVLGFSYRLSELVRNHVKTKKYLVARNEEYRKNLSDASLGTLEYQGGPMTSEECDEYEKTEFFQDHLKVRELDDLAKEKDVKTHTWDYFLPLIEKCLNKSG